MRYSLLFLPLALPLCVQAEMAQEDIEHITVTSDFRQHSLLESPASTALIDETALERESAEHLQEVLHNIPNLNWSGGTSRPRYFQIRGVGERDQYTGAPNSSVGFILDDMDLSGLGMAASLYDIQQLEVLRGPQGTRYGANALAGLIYVKSQEPTEQTEAGTELTLADDQLWSVGGFVSGALTQDQALTGRISIHQHTQNGFVDNHYLNRDDSNERDEFTARVRLNWQLNPSLLARLSLLHADMDNGYDAWTLDNNGFNSLSDQPGRDEQTTDGAALRLEWQLNPNILLHSISSLVDTDHDYGYDGDWANPDYWSGLSCSDDYDADGDGQFDDLIPCQYDYTWRKQGERKTYTQELRLLSSPSGRLFNQSTDWLLGVYANRLEESNDTKSFYNGWPDEALQSDYEATNLAVFLQLDSDFGEGVALSVGLRLEQRQTDYSDDAGDSFDPDETMWGGHIMLGKQLNAAHHIYAKVARGYKAGGFNMSLPESLTGYKEFDTETLYNYELGLNSQWLDGDISSRISLFYMDRQDQQVEASLQNPDNPQRFILYTANATSSSSYGLELEADWQLLESTQLYTSLGLLETAYDDYLFRDKYGTELDLKDRELAHAPSYHYTLGVNLDLARGWLANINLTGMDHFYFSDSHNQQSQRYALLNAKLGYYADNWSLAIWGRNLTDEEYATRGYFFGNEPDQGWANKLYQRYGDPRLLGMTFRYEWR